MNAGRPIGIAIAKREEERKLCTVWVHEKYRRQGVASALVEEAIESLEQNGPYSPCQRRGFRNSRAS